MCVHAHVTCNMHMHMHMHMLSCSYVCGACECAACVCVAPASHHEYPGRDLGRLLVGQLTVERAQCVAQLTPQAALADLSRRARTEADQWCMVGVWAQVVGGRGRSQAVAAVEADSF